MNDVLEPQQTRRQTILVVDDEEIVRKTITLIFEQRMGYKVIVATDGKEAEALFTSHSSELALLVVEIALPIVSGSDFVMHLPTLARRIPVLFITSMGEFEVEEDVARQFPILQKPFRADTLITAAKPLISAAATAD